MPAGSSLAFPLPLFAHAIPLPGAAVLPKPDSCGLTQVRAGDSAREAGVEIPPPTTWRTSYPWSCELPPPGRRRSEGGVSRATEEALLHLWSPSQPRQPVQLKGKAFLHSQHWGRHSRASLRRWEARQRGQGLGLPGQLLSARWGRCSACWDPECRLPTQLGSGKNKRPAQSFVPAHLLGCSLESLARRGATQSAICRGAPWKCSVSAPPWPCWIQGFLLSNIPG